MQTNQPILDHDIYWMQQAIRLAKHAASQGEVPVGAVLVDASNQPIAEGFNRPIQACDPTAHAEIVTLRKAGKKIKNYRLIHTTLYTTLEPCLMCIGAMLHARVQRVVFGALDSKAGAVIHLLPILLQKKTVNGFNHKIDYVGGLLEAECGALLRQFFDARR